MLKAGALVACLAALVTWTIRSGDAEVGAGRGSAVAEPPSSASPTIREPARDQARTPAPERGPVGAIDVREPALEAALERVVERWLSAAAERSKGVVTRANTHVSVCVREAGVGELAALDADLSVAPASNMKLVTTAVALVLLGPDWNFETRFYPWGAVEQGTLRGDLIVLGGGDPFFDPELRGRSEHLLDPAVEALALHGIRRIEGDLVLDPCDFPDPAPGRAWPSADQHWDDYCALAAALTVNGGILVTEVTPSASNGPARLSVHPAPTGLKELYGVTTEAGAKLDVRVGATAAGVTVKGTIPAGIDTWTGDFAHPDPYALFAAVLRDRLRRGGIEVSGGWRVRRSERVTRMPPMLEPLVVLRTPLLDVLGPINTHSVNSVADALFMAMGGADMTWIILRNLDIPPEGLVYVDGSGLSRDNRITARQLAALVDKVATFDYDASAAWLQSLALAGETGTLEDRMTESTARGRVAAKTGWIKGASALSGVADSLAGKRYCFSILVAYPPNAGGLNTHCWKPMQDELCQLLVEWGS